MKTQQKGPGRTKKAQDVKTISPETWARLRPLARALIVEITELLAEDAPTERVIYAFQHRHGEKAEDGPFEIAEVIQRGNIGETYSFQEDGIFEHFLPDDRTETPEGARIAEQEVKAIMQAHECFEKSLKAGRVYEVVLKTP